MVKKILKFLGLGIALYLLTLLLWRQGIFMTIQHRLQNASYDADRPSPEIVIVAIDEKSLSPDQLGPLNRWRRAYYAQAIEALNKAGAKAIGIDLTFPDASFYGPEDDQKLAESLKASPNVVLAARYYFENRQFKIELPNPALMETNRRFGWINVKLDPDGFVRQIPVLPRASADYVRAAFSLEVLRAATPSMATDIPTFVQYDPTARHEMELMYVNYFSRPYGFTHVSFADVLGGNFIDKQGKPVDFKNKIVLIGPTAIDLQDDYLSPVSEGVRMPGVEIHANAIQTVLEKKFLRDQSHASFLIELAVLMAVNLMAFALLRISFSLILLLLEVAGLFVAGIAAYEFQIFLNIVHPLFLVLSSFVGVLLLRFILEQKERRFLKQAFGHYVNKEVVEAVLKNPKMLALGGAKKEVTVLFSDIAGFTSISEKMEPEKLVGFLNEYLDEMTKIILENHGTLDKYEGDGLMAFWGAPLPQTDHAKRACAAALAQQKRLAELRQKWAKEKKPEIHIRIGVNTGDAVVGNMGSANRFDYTATGDTVNLGSRLEGINKQYGTPIIISEFTYRQVKDDFTCRELDLIRVKGKQKAVRIYELLSEEGNGKNLKKFEEALALYREKKFDGAKRVFAEMPDDPASQVFATRCEHFLQNPPPPDWDGVWEFTVK